MNRSGYSIILLLRLLLVLDVLASAAHVSLLDSGRFVPAYALQFGRSANMQSKDSSVSRSSEDSCCTSVMEAFMFPEDMDGITGE